jgi:hypothetical protein
MVEMFFIQRGLGNMATMIFIHATVAKPCKPPIALANLPGR